ncbi:tyrosine-type recombinase/integrase [Actinoplanes friuliensis]|uniref:LacI family transcriptional regulator n=1 Tax=Actinoplanes friuliensis DSM 7358 TaxID=1246995 RepID=U5VS27_9ACTN|nr:LacI family transcriptional regulator [Actinoplanes friuliensis]AGZ39592.1 LacI family transcriptional regulator [Actinoplanes friuliensis DSM 7358]
MAYAEKRGGLWRARWRGPDGTLESEPGFQTEKAALKYGRDQEAAIRARRYVDPRGGRMTVTEWVNIWFPALDLEPSTLDSYRYLLEVFVLPEFGDSTLMSLTNEGIAKWEMKLVKSGYSKKTASNARGALSTTLGDAVPRYIPLNPAAKSKGKGRKGSSRIERIEKESKVWASPLQTLLIAERAAIISGLDATFIADITIQYTGCRWSEMLALPPELIHDDAIDVHWKLYELNGRFYRGRPKDGSMRTVATPPFLNGLLSHHLSSKVPLKCSCVPQLDDKDGISWCTGDAYTFLTAEGRHYRRSNFSERVFRPAADGWYPRRSDKRDRMPVLVDYRHPWPGKPLPPWPAVEAGQEYVAPQGRGRPRVTEDSRLASWLPVLPGLTPHGQRHGYQTWLDEDGIPYVAQSQQMGHEVPGMRGVYSHVTDRMLNEVRDALQQRWLAALKMRATLSPTSAVPSLNAALLTHSAPM